MRGMKVFLVIALLLVAAGIGFYVWQRGEAPKMPPPPLEGPKVTVPNEPAPPRFPMGESEKALPALKESDPTILQALAALVGPDAVARYLVPEELVRHIVV